jgi:RTA1 like protein
VIIMGGLWETFSSVLLALGSQNQQNIGYSVAHTLLFLLAPLWINAFAYMTAARLAHLLLPDRRLVVPAARLARIFVALDIASFVVQAVGGVMASPGAGPSVITAGLHVYTGGVAAQLAFIGVFTALLARMWARLAAMERADGLRRADGRWRGVVVALFVALACIAARICFRIAEFARGITPANPVPFHEAYSYVFDAFPMMVALLVLAVVHPGRVLVGRDSKFPSWRERRAVKRAIKEEKAKVKEERKRERREARQGARRGVLEDGVGEGPELHQV